MKTRLWLRILVSLVGLIALSALIWFGGPLAGRGTFYPFEDIAPRVIAIALFALLVFGIIAFDIYKRAKQAAAIEKTLAEGAEAEGDGAVLGERMKDALLTLKKASGSSANFLYELPWYMLIGPPGSGKTTALVNSGLKFPLARGGATPEAIAGIGGTRYCDWWFTEDAVLIDTAGRYTTQDSDAKADRKSWLAFLDLLKSNRPRQPVNGVLVCISVEDLLRCSPAEVNAHADAIRTRLLELHTQLRVDFPVYALFTKLDLVAGFLEFFSTLNEAARRVVWGATFQTDDKTQNLIGEVGPEFDALIERLNLDLPDRLQEEPTSAARVQVFGFPAQMAALRPTIVDFLGRIFEPTRYHTNATLRGFYFTSGTQEGTPIDQLIGALQKNFGGQQVATPVFSGGGKSFFLTDLITKVIIGESAWVSTDKRAVRRSIVRNVLAYSLLFLVSLGAAAAWWVSYGKNSDLIAQSNEQAKGFVAVAAPIIQEPFVADRDFAKIDPLLTQLRALPAGFAQQNDAVPTSATFGLSQWDRLNTSAEAIYRTGLERWLRTRLIFRLEELFEANQNNPEFIYEALKVYLILGGRQKMDKDLILAWITRDFTDNLYPGAAFAQLRISLIDHVTAMLDGEGGGPPPALNNVLIEDARKILGRLSLAQRAYQLLKAQARPSAGKEDWVASKKGGLDAKTVFASKNGNELDLVRVPYFFTYDGFQTAFIGRMREVAGQIQGERWVLGEAADESALSSQYDTLPPDLLKIYSREHDQAWTRALGDLQLRPLNAGKPQYPALSAISSVTSPLKTMLEAIRDETQLTVEKKKPAAPAAINSALEKVNAAKNAVTETAAFANQSIGNRSLDLALKAMEKKRADGVVDDDIPGRDIELRFKSYHAALEGDQGKRAIDQVLAALSDVNQNFRLMATNPALLSQVNATLPQQIQVLRNAANLLPKPFSQMMLDAANSIDKEVTGSSVSELMRLLNEQVTVPCRRITNQLYPFDQASSRDVPMADFGKLFGTGGLMDAFFKQNLANLVDTTKNPWVYRQNISVARALPDAALREFQRAAEIREAFFPTGGALPSVMIAITPLFTPSPSETIRLEVNGIAVQPNAQGSNLPTSVQWPGPAGLDRTVISIQTSGFFGSGPPTYGLDKRGPWSFFRFLDSTGIQSQGDTMYTAVGIGGRSVRYQINVGSLRNPLKLPALRTFSCPA